MARYNHTGLMYCEYWRCNCWEGTAEQLIDAGIIERHLLPGEPGRNKACVTYGGGRNQHDCVRDENYAQILRLSKNRYRVQKGLPKAEADRRQVLRDEQRRKFLQQQGWRRFAKHAISQFSESEAGFKESTTQKIENMATVIRLIVDGRLSGGYFVDAASEAKICHFLNGIRDVFAKAKVSHNENLRTAMIELLNDDGEEIEPFEAMKMVEIDSYKRPKLRLVPSV